MTNLPTNYGSPLKMNIYKEEIEYYYIKIRYKCKKLNSLSTSKIKNRIKKFEMNIWLHDSFVLVVLQKSDFWVTNKKF